MADAELEAMVKLSEALSPLDDDARNRVLQWASAKFRFVNPTVWPTATRPTTAVNFPALAAEPRGGEVPGIAKITETGELRLTVRDLKAKNANDAAIRLAHIAIHAYQQLTGEGAASSRRIVTPILKHWRLYNGNTRNALARHKGIIREGDLLSLDAHARQEADRYIEEALDPSNIGKWRPPT